MISQWLLLNFWLLICAVVSWLLMALLINLLAEINLLRLQSVGIRLLFILNRVQVIRHMFRHQVIVPPTRFGWILDPKHFAYCWVLSNNFLSEDRALNFLELGMRVLYYFFLLVVRLLDHTAQVGYVLWFINDFLVVKRISIRYWFIVFCDKMSHLLVMKYFFTDFALAGVRRQVLYVFLGDAASETGHLTHSV